MSTTKKVIAFARTKPEGFKAAEVRAVIKGDPKRLYVALSTLKKKGALTHDAATGVYKLGESMVNSKTVQVTAPTPEKKSKGFENLMSMVREENLKIKKEREDAALTMLDNMLKEVQETSEKYQDALAIIRYLESKLITAIQHDARGRS